MPESRRRAAPTPARYCVCQAANSTRFAATASWASSCSSPSVGVGGFSVMTGEPRPQRSASDGEARLRRHAQRHGVEPEATREQLGRRAEMGNAAVAAARAHDGGQFEVAAAGYAGQVPIPGDLPQADDADPERHFSATADRSARLACRCAR